MILIKSLLTLCELGDRNAGGVVEAILTIAANLRLVEIDIHHCTDQTIAQIIKGVEVRAVSLRSLWIDLPDGPSGRLDQAISATHDLRCIVYSPGDLITPSVMQSHAQLRLVGVKIQSSIHSDHTALYLMALLSALQDAAHLQRFALTMPGRDGQDEIIALRLLDTIQDLCARHEIGFSRRMPTISEVRTTCLDCD